MQWGDEARINELFGKRGSVKCVRRDFMFRYNSAEHWIDIFRKFYVPTHKAFAALDEAGQNRLHDALAALLNSRNTAGGS